MSNILKVWTSEAQQRLVDTVRVRLTLYADEVKPGQRKRKDPDALFWRGKMLAAAARRGAGGTIYVPCLGNFAWDLWDLGRCLAAAKDSGTTVLALNTGHRIPPDADDATMRQAREDFAADKRRGAARPGRAGYEVTAELKRADTLRRIELIRKDWGDLKFTQEELLLRAGRKTSRGHIQPMAWKTARQHLNTRRWAVAHRAGMKRSRAEKGQSE